MDAKISLELITGAAKRIVPNAINMPDVGCGAWNYTLMMLSKVQNLNCTLVDLSGPMLDKALERVSEKTNGLVEIIQGDLRTVQLKKIILIVFWLELFYIICGMIWIGNYLLKTLYTSETREVV